MGTQALPILRSCAHRWGRVLMNLLAIPLCVTAGTLFFCDRILVVPPLPPGTSPPAEKSPS